MRSDEIVVAATIITICVIIMTFVCYSLYRKAREEGDAEKYTIDIREHPNMLIITVKNPLQDNGKYPV